MYISLACLASLAISSSGPARYPTRTPGLTVFENEEAWITLPVSSRESMVGGGSSSNESSR